MVPDGIMQDGIMARRKRAGLPNRGPTSKTGSRQTRWSTRPWKGGKREGGGDHSYSVPATGSFDAQKDGRRKAIGYLSQGMICQNREEYDEAMTFYDMAIEADPTNIKAYTNKGMVLAIIEKLDEGLVYLEKAIKLASAAAPDKSHVEVYTNMAGALGDLGRHDEAVNYLDMAFDCLDKNDLRDQNWMVVSCMFEVFGEKEKAVACRRTDSNLAWKYYMEGAEMMALDRDKESVACFDRAIREDPSFAEAYYYKGQMMSILERPADAAACFRQTVKANPDFALAYSDLAMELDDMGKIDEALELAETALRKRPDLGFAHFCKGSILAGAEQYKEAIACFDRAIELNTEEVAVYFQKGASHRMLGENREALQCFDHALELDPHNAYVHDIKSEVEQLHNTRNIGSLLGTTHDRRYPRP